MKALLWLGLGILCVPVLFFGLKFAEFHFFYSTQTASTPSVSTFVQTGSTGQAGTGTPDPVQTAALSPATLLVTDVKSMHIVLSWPSSAGATHYEVYRSNYAQFSTATRLATTKNTTFTDINMLPGAQYYYWVVGVNSFGAGPPLARASVMAPLSLHGMQFGYPNSVVRLSTDNTIFGSLGPGDFGTGFFVQGGYIVTNMHVVARADYTIGVYNGANIRIGRAKIKYLNAAEDMALLYMVSGTPGPALPLGPLPHSGDRVTILGYPGGLNLGSSTGTVEQTGATVTVPGYPPKGNMIVTDAQTEPGNSGSPLINEYGQVVGIIEAVSAGDANNGYAVPATWLSIWGFQTQGSDAPTTSSIAN